MNKPLMIFLLLSLAGCGCESECEIEPISKNIFDINKIDSKDLIITSQNNTDTLKFIEKWDSYTETSFKGLMNYRECGHNKSYKYGFRNETIQVALNKNDQQVIELELIGWFNPVIDRRVVTENDILKNKEFIFEREENSDTVKSKIKTIVIKGYTMKSIETIDNKVWICKL